jgi:hypothetical protein
MRRAPLQAPNEPAFNVPRTLVDELLDKLDETPRELTR